MNDPQDVAAFEQEWVALAEEVIRQIFDDPEIQKIKAEVRAGGGVTWEQKNTFIEITNRIKSDLIGQRYGEVGSDSYNEFTRRWEEWQRERGRKRERASNLFEENINHLLYGSTPDPEQFLRDFDINQI